MDDYKHWALSSNEPLMSRLAKPSLENSLLNNPMDGMTVGECRSVILTHTFLAEQVQQSSHRKSKSCGQHMTLYLALFQLLERPLRLIEVCDFPFRVLFDFAPRSQRFPELLSPSDQRSYECQTHVRVFAPSRFYIICRQGLRSSALLLRTECATGRRGNRDAY